MSALPKCYLYSESLRFLIFAAVLVYMFVSVKIAARDQLAIEQRRNETTSVIHIATLNEGVARCGQIETLIKSILLNHNGIIHVHVFADERSREMLSVMFRTWPLERLRWSLYEMEAVHGSGQWLPSVHHSGTIGVFKFFPDDVLPLYVEKLIVIDSDTLLLDDIQNLHDYFYLMEKRGAFWATAEDQYWRFPEREPLPHKDRLGENNGILLLDLKKMRSIGEWNNVWKNETFSMYENSGPLVASDQDVFTSLAFWFPQWHYRLPCVYNFQMGEWALWMQCVGEFRDYSVVKIAHWTEGIKWDGVHTNVRHFTHIYRCVQGIDGSVLGASKAAQNTRRTLHFIRDYEEPPKQFELTLAAHVPFDRSYATIERLNRWPGPVSLVVFGADEQKMRLNNFLHKNVHLLSDRLAVHFVHPAAGEEEYPSAYLAKIAIDAARTERVLVATELERLDVSRMRYGARMWFITDVHFKLWQGGDDRDLVTIIRSKKDLEVVGAVMNKSFAQLINAKGLTVEEAVVELKLKSTNFLSQEPINYMETLKDSTVQYPTEHFCHVQISSRNPVVPGWKGRKGFDV